MRNCETTMTIARITELDFAAIDILCAESVAEGHKFVARLFDEWRSGMNRFNAPGEAFFVAESATGIVGVCGLNRDPYAGDASIGRIRHLYVLRAHRREGIGRALITAVIDAARIHFRTLRLRTTPAAEAFYRALGFKCVTPGHDPTYVLELAG